MKPIVLAAGASLASLIFAACLAPVGTRDVVIEDGGGAADSGTPAFGDAGNAACDHFYAAQYTRCGGPVLPASEAARELARFEQFCRNEAALPGSPVTAASLESCASALDQSSCGIGAFGLQVCAFRGSLPAASPCTDGIQCQSGDCGGTTTMTPEGPIGPVVCGTCAAPSCPPDQVCLTNPETEKCNCTPVTYVGAGASCNDQTRLCQPGLYCAMTAPRTCRRLGGAGDPCGVASPPGPPGPPGSIHGEADPEACAAPSYCDAVALVCASSPDGGPCANDLDCAPGLGCIPTGPCCGRSGVCAPVQWAGSGEPCSDAVRCLVGSCGFPSFGPVTQAPDGGLLTGTCPTVIPDGQPCTVGPPINTTCDAFSECFQGACIPTDSIACH